MTAAVLAHQGGWDEALFVAAPLIVFAGLLYVANKRADKQNASNKSDADKPKITAKKTPSSEGKSARSK